MNILALGDIVTSEWATSFGKELEQSTWRGAGALKSVLPCATIVAICQKAAAVLHKEPTLLEILPAQGSEVVVVGDTHGQVHDILRMFETAGLPSENRQYIFNGDFVDRGAWGLEVLLIFLVWKLALPNSIWLLRGNHESTTCTTMYGFKGEVEQKYGKPEGQMIYKCCKRLFATLPLAARINAVTLVLHGGLFRKPTPARSGKNKRKKRKATTQCELGSLEDLRDSGKGGQDPNGRGSTIVATDVLWSDPVGAEVAEGLHPNVTRGVGVVFGPDVTQRFLVENGLKLILRSHEGPDARFEREDMASMLEGWTLDHQVPAGKLMTIFSAPDYPQFQPEEDQRYLNRAAVAVLKAPDWCTPQMLQYEAVLPRPPAVAFYDYLYLPGSDEEIEIAGSEASQASLVSAFGDLIDTAVNKEIEEHAEPPLVGSAAAQDQNLLEVVPATSAMEAPKHGHLPFAAPLENSLHNRRTSLRQRMQKATKEAGLCDTNSSQAQSIDGTAEVTGMSEAAAATQIAMSSEAVEDTSIQSVDAPRHHPDEKREDASLASDSRAQLPQPGSPALEAIHEGPGGPGVEAALHTGDSSVQTAELTMANDKPSAMAADTELQTPESSLALHMQMHPGRELEQAAAHTLAIQGGLGMQTPETGQSIEESIVGHAVQPEDCILEGKEPRQGSDLGPDKQGISRIPMKRSRQPAPWR